MNIETAKQINLADYLHSLGYSPVKTARVSTFGTNLPFEGRERSIVQSEYRT